MARTCRPKSPMRWTTLISWVSSSPADELDVVIYSLDKAVRLLLKSNPNIVGLLWLRENEYVHRHEAFGLLHWEKRKAMVRKFLGAVASALAWD